MGIAAMLSEGLWAMVFKQSPETTDENQLEVAQQNALATRERITRQFPDNLAKREAQLLERLQKVKGDSFKKLKVLYAFIDELYAFINKFTPCKAGCSDCCHHPVNVSELEIQYIEKATGIKRAAEALSFDPAENLPCPLLKNNACSIYEYRPFVCRTHVSLCQTAIWCHSDKCHQAKLPMLRFSEVEKAHKRLLRDSNLSATQDIRQVFKPKRS